MSTDPGARAQTRKIREALFLHGFSGFPWIISDFFGQRSGGVEEDRTPDLRIANAALSQLSYHPVEGGF